MRSKHLIILTVLFVFLLVMVFAKKGMEPQRLAFEEKTDIIKEQLSLGVLASVLISILDTNAASSEDTEKTLRFLKQDDSWIAEGYYGLPVIDSKLITLMNRINQLEGELRSSTSAVFDDYGITDEAGIHIKLDWITGNQKHLIVGTERVGRKGNFVRLAGSEDVYYVDINLLSPLGFSGSVEVENLNYDTWVDKKVLSLNTKNVLGISYVDKDLRSRLNITREEVDGRRKWVFKNSYSLSMDAAKVKAYIEKLANLRALKIVNLMEIDDSDSRDVVTLIMDTQERVIIAIGGVDTESEGWLVEVSGKSCAFVVAKPTLEALFVQDGTFFVDNPLGVNVDDIEGIHIEDLEQKKKIELSKFEKILDRSDTAEEPPPVMAWMINEKKEISDVLPEALINAFKNVKLQAGTDVNLKENPVFKISLVKQEETVTFVIGPKSDDSIPVYFFRIMPMGENYLADEEFVSSIRSAIQQLITESKRKSKNKS